VTNSIRGRVDYFHRLYQSHYIKLPIEGCTAQITFLPDGSLRNGYIKGDFYYLEIPIVDCCDPNGWIYDTYFVLCVLVFCYIAALITKHTIEEMKKEKCRVTKGRESRERGVVFRYAYCTSGLGRDIVMSRDKNPG
jgi:hypothetical protein